MGARRARARSTQAEFLRNLGIEKRAAALKALATPEKAAEIDSAVKRLLGEGRTEMGKLFKVHRHRRSEARQLAGLRARSP